MPKIFENKIVYEYVLIPAPDASKPLAPTGDLKRFRARVSGRHEHDPIHTINCLHRKYPNPYATHVVSVDTIGRTIDPETGILRSERVIGVHQGAPKWITKLFSLPPVAYVREIIFVDPEEPRATCMSQNLNLAQYVSCLELITYTPYIAPPSTSSQKSRRNPFSSSSPSTNTPPSLASTADTPRSLSTLFSQRAIMISGFPTALIARRIEKASVDRFSSNADVGRTGFEWVLSGGTSSPSDSQCEPLS